MKKDLANSKKKRLAHEARMRKHREREQRQALLDEKIRLAIDAGVQCGCCLLESQKMLANL